VITGPRDTVKRARKLRSELTLPERKLGLRKTEVSPSHLVIPAKAEIQSHHWNWIPAFAGMTNGV
jgi:hypothetical protein